MPTLLPDSCVIIPAVQGWHEHHDIARNELRRRLDDGEHMVLAAHSLLECYSVLTRLPGPLRMAPGAVLELIKTNFIDRGTVVGLSAEQYLELLTGVGAAGVVGGRTYDALIARCSDVSRVDELLTFNVRHFTGLTTHSTVMAPRPGP